MGLKLSIDSGGTKILAVLFDGDFRLIAFGKGGSANKNFDSADTILTSIKQGLEPCLEACKGQELERVYVTSLGSYDSILQVLREHCALGEVIEYSEAAACLRAGIQRREGTVALAGTGSTVFGVCGSQSAYVGGWGSWVGDEGSGYDMGRRAIGAAIRHVEGRGMDTLLTDAVLRHFDMAKLQDLSKLLYKAPSVRAFISSVSPLVSQAASAGDEVAIQILSDSGREMGEMATALWRREPALRTNAITIAGSVWKGSRHMFDSFVRTVRTAEPGAIMVTPRYEPVMGGVIEEALQMQDGESAALRTIDEAFLQMLDTRFEPFKYRTQWNEAQ